MAKYRKKPVVIDAIQYDGFNASEIAGFVGEGCRISREMDAPLFIDTLEGTMEAQRGDYIIKGIKGEFHPCKPDIFEATYEAVE